MTKLTLPRSPALFLVLLLCALNSLPAAQWIRFTGKSGPGHGKRVVLLAGDEEYRSEESMPMLARILAERHGFDCTVLFPINAADGTINPNIVTNIPGMEALEHADLCIMALRFRELPDSQMRHFVNYLNAGKPLIALRTSTHAFQYPPGSLSPYAKYDWRSQAWAGGFGEQVLGETWVSHHGEHGKESTRGLLDQREVNDPILNGVKNIWVPTDVYTVAHLPKTARVLVWGEVLAGMTNSAPPVQGPKNHPMMPVAWLRTYKGEDGKISKIFTTTMGAAVDLQCTDLRRLLVNACYWATGLESRIPPSANVDFVGKYRPSWFGFGTFKKGVRPDELERE